MFSFVNKVPSEILRVRYKLKTYTKLTNSVLKTAVNDKIMLVNTA